MEEFHYCLHKPTISHKQVREETHTTCGSDDSESIPDEVPNFFAQTIMTSPDILGSKFQNKRLGRSFVCLDNIQSLQLKTVITLSKMMERPHPVSASFVSLNPVGRTIATRPQSLVGLLF